MIKVTTMGVGEIIKKLLFNLIHNFYFLLIRADKHLVS